MCAHHGVHGNVPLRVERFGHGPPPARAANVTRTSDRRVFATCVGEPTQLGMI